MKKRIVLLFFSCIFFLPSFSQPIFTKKYNLPLIFAKLIDAAPDGGYYFSGYKLYDAVIGKTDSLGNIQWVKQIGDAATREIPWDLIVLDNGNVVVTIQWYDFALLKAYIVEFDLTGNLIFFKRYANADAGNYNWPNNIIKDGNGFCLSVSNYPLPETRLLKADSMGNKLNNTFVGMTEWKIFKTSAGNYILRDPGSTAEFCLLNSSLIYQNAVYTDVYPNDNEGMIEISNGSYLVYGGDLNPAVEKLNSQLEVVWQKFFNIPNVITGNIKSARKINANKIALFGQGDDIGTGVQPCIFEIDTLGNVLNCKLITTEGYNPHQQPGECVYNNNRFTFMYGETQGALQTPICFKITSTDTAFSSVCNALDTTMIVTDDLLDISGSLTFPHGIKNDSLITDSLPIVNITFAYGDCNDSTLYVNSYLNLQNDFIITPNPVNSTLNIFFNKIKDIRIINILGEIVLQKGFSNVMEGKIELDVSFLSSGIYFIKAGNEVRKFVKE